MKYRTQYINELTEESIGKEIKACGFVENIRDHGGVIFVDVRDETGVLQIVSNDDSIFNGLTKESSVTLTGTVRMRDEENFNPKISTGTIEVLVSVDDIGKVIGKKGIIASSIRTIVQASSYLNHEKRVFINIDSFQSLCFYLQIHVEIFVYIDEIHDFLYNADEVMSNDRKAAD